VIFRLGAPKGSSILARRPELKENARFDKPIIEFTTKLEDEDRGLTWDEAAAVAALTSGELQQLAELTTQVAFELSAMLEKVGVEVWDGTVEWAWAASRSFLLVDAIGLDELRVSYQGLPLSKEFLRQHYRRTQWFADLNRAKAEALKTDADFKEICLREFKSAPAPLPVKIKHSAQLLYTAFANDLCALYRRERPWGEHVTLKTWQESLA
jgi:phosphoribosylaminoimidazole-succinocarboxamide synthase